MTIKLSDYLLRKWSVQVRRADRVCQVCGSRDSLQAHHIASKSYFPERAYELANGVALCGGRSKGGRCCHQTLHNMLMGSTRKKCVEADMVRFARLYEWSTGEATPYLMKMADEARAAR